MFKIYDLNMKELPFPEGVKPLDIFVSSVNKRRITEEFEGRSGALNYGFDYGERSVDLSLWLEAHDTIDYRLIRNELYAFFDAHDVFYIEETRVPSRVLKVTIDESYIPERINQTHSSVEVSCRTLDSVFWESKYTTLELHDSGYSATAEKYGLVDNIDDEKVKYRFTPEILTQNVGANPFKNGFLSSTTGAESESTTNIIIGTYMNVVAGNNYQFIDEGTNGNVRFWWIYEYSESDTFIKSHSFSNKNFSFKPEGKKLKFMAQAQPDKSLSPNDIGINILPKLLRPSSVNTFIVYNAGNVTVEPESSYLEIVANTVVTPGGFTITNKTTGDEFIFNAELNGLSLLLKGMDIRVSSVYNRFRDTNRRFIRLAPGDNEFEVKGGTFDHIRFDFKYLYK